MMNRLSGICRYRHWMLALLTVAIILVVAGYFLGRSGDAGNTGEAWQRQGQAFLEAGNTTQAYRCFAKAFSLAPDNALYAWFASQAAFLMGDSSSSRGYVQKAWAAGKRDRESFLRQMLLSEKRGEEKFSEARALVMQMPQGVERDDLSGDVDFAFGRFEEAVKQWRALFVNDPGTHLMNKIAQALIRLGKLQEATACLRKAGPTCKPDLDSFCLLSVLLAMQDDWDGARQALVDADMTLGPQPVIRLKRGELAIALGEFDDSVKLLQQLACPSGDTNTSMVRPADMDSEQLQMQWQSSYDNRYRANIIAHQARLLLAHVFFSQGKFDQIDALLQLAQGNEKYLESERLFLQALQTFSTRGAGVSESFNRARILSTPNFVIDLYCARSAYQDGNYSQAVSCYHQIKRSNALIYQSAPVMLELAQALIRDRQQSEALAVLDSLHRRGIYSRMSLELQRELAQRLGALQESQAANKTLRTAFADDVSVRLGEGLWALSCGEFDAAQEIMSALADQHPDNPVIVSSRLSLLLARGEYENALQEAENSHFATEVTAPVRAKALARLGRVEDALVAFQQACEYAYDPNIMLEYAVWLRKAGKIEEAEHIYRTVIKQTPERAEAWLGLGFLLMEQGDSAQAYATASTMLSDQGKAVEGHLLSAWLCLREEQFDQVLIHCLDVEKQRSDLPGLSVLKARALIPLGRMEAATVVLQPYLDRNPTDDDARLLLAMAYSGCGQYASVFRVLGELQRPDSPVASRIRLEAQLASGDARGAASTLLNLKPFISEADFSLYQAWLMQLQKKPQDALDVLWQQRQDKRALSQWAILKMKMYPSADLLEQIKGSDLTPERWTLLGLIAESWGKIDVAWACYRAGLKAYPDHPVLLNNFAWVALQGGLSSEMEILQAAAKAYQIRPGTPPFLETYAAALIRFKKFAECQLLLQQADRITGQSVNLLLYRAMTFEALDKKVEALVDYETAYERCRDSVQGQAILMREEIGRRIEVIREAMGKELKP